MRLVWRSCQGRQRSSNSDAVAVGRRAGLLFCMLVDAAEKSDDSQRFAWYWGKQVVMQLLAEPYAHEADAVVSLLGREQGRLREGFLMEIGSYCLLSLETETGLAQVFHVGDCLAGQMEGKVVSWWVSPHTLDRELSPGARSERHILTRSLNAKRFAAPDIMTAQMPVGGTLILASDGYWAESLREGCPFGETQDDASYLTIATGAPDFSPLSDTDNFFLVGRHSQ